MRKLQDTRREIRDEEDQEGLDRQRDRDKKDMQRVFENHVPLEGEDDDERQE